MSYRRLHNLLPSTYNQHYKKVRVSRESRIRNTHTHVQHREQVEVEREAVKVIQAEERRWR